MGQMFEPAIVVVREPYIIEAQWVQNRGMQITHLLLILGGLNTELVGCSDHFDVLNSAAGEPRYLGRFVMVAPWTDTKKNIILSDVRPNSPVQIASVSPNNPHCLRSRYIPAIARVFRRRVTVLGGARPDF